ncbi:MAG TPA: HD domain-containing protein [Isosphaeraceae bacterium]|jgi:phosphonate degradation associated HDIG domain protein|nr:HD domain-containing protein [Isosphaeraceae bacterium]
MATENNGVVSRVLRLFAERGDSDYGSEAVSQRAHALQAAHLARQSGADPALVAAALLHDVGHLLHNLPDDAPDRGIDDRHEELAARWLARHFRPEVAEPVRLHVAAKRYLCATETSYYEQLSEPSRVSLALQGGPMSAEEVEGFRASPHFEDAVRLRRWDDEAKDPGLLVPGLEAYVPDLEAALAGGR